MVEIAQKHEWMSLLASYGKRFVQEKDLHS